MEYKIVSLFTGTGGLDIGFEKHGFETLICVDNDPSACLTLKHNRPNWPVFLGNIENFSCGGKIDGVIGGPPCQGFSTAGKGNPNDPRNLLWKEYFRVVERTSPDFIMIENVPGMMHNKNKHHFDELINHFKKLGFTINYGIVNAADFGVPQIRKRLIIVGGRGFSIELPKAKFSEYVSVRKAISDLEQIKKFPNHQPNNHAQHVVKRWSLLREGETDPNYRRARLIADQPSPTIRAGGGYGPKGDHLAGFHPPIHYKLPRQLTVREAARLQGFDDAWIFQGSKTAQGRQVGNAVPPPLAEAIASEIRKALENRKTKKTDVSFEWFDKSGLGEHAN